MYSSKNFYEMCSKYLLDKDDFEHMEILRIANKRLDDSNRSDMSYNPSGDRERLTLDEVKIVHDLNRNVIKKYVAQQQVKEIATLNEAINELLKETTRIYYWHNDVNVYAKILAKQGKNYNDDDYARNYWYFMEWQGDVFTILQAFIQLNGESIPIDLSVSKKDLNRNFSIISGCKQIKEKDELIKDIYFYFQTAYAWAYVEEENSWINHSMTNSTNKSFIEHIQFFIRLVSFLEKYLADNEFILSTEKNFNIANYVDENESIFKIV